MVLRKSNAWQVPELGMTISLTPPLKPKPWMTVTRQCLHRVAQEAQEADEQHQKANEQHQKQRHLCGQGGADHGAAPGDFTVRLPDPNLNPNLNPTP